MIETRLDGNGRSIQLHDVEDKTSWCEFGMMKENEFIQKYGLPLNLKINPEKTLDKYAPDLLEADGVYGDLKTCTTPFFTAGRYSLDPRFTVTFNQKDQIRYVENYPDINIWFWVDWKTISYENPHSKIIIEPLSGIWMIPFKKLSMLLEKAPLHQLQKRIFDDKGNGKANFLIDLRNSMFRRFNPRMTFGGYMFERRFNQSVFSA
jgi:hypothetical protein